MCGEEYEGFGRKGTMGISQQGAARDEYVQS